MAVVAVLEIHIDRNIVVNMKPSMRRAWRRIMRIMPIDTWSSYEDADDDGDDNDNENYDAP
jgi:hypothetical protein